MRALSCRVKVRGAHNWSTVGYLPSTGGGSEDAIHGYLQHRRCHRAWYRLLPRQPSGYQFSKKKVNMNVGESSVKMNTKCIFDNRNQIRLLLMLDQAWNTRDRVEFVRNGHSRNPPILFFISEIRQACAKDYRIFKINSKEPDLKFLISMLNICSMLTLHSIPVDFSPLTSCWHHLRPHEPHLHSTISLKCVSNAFFYTSDVSKLTLISKNGFFPLQSSTSVILG